MWISGKGTPGSFSFTFHRILFYYEWTYVFGVFLPKVTQTLEFFSVVFDTFSQMESCDSSLIPVPCSRRILLNMHFSQREKELWKQWVLDP